NHRGPLRGSGRNRPGRDRLPGRVRANQDGPLSLSACEPSTRYPLCPRRIVLTSTSTIERRIFVTTLTVTDIPLDAESPPQRLRRTAAAVRVSIHWWGVHRALTPRQKEEVGIATSADARFLTAGKKLIDIRHEAVRRLTGIRTRLSNFWRGTTLPFTEVGVRL